MTKRIVWTFATLLAGAATALAQQQQLLPVPPDGWRAPASEPSIDWWTILYFVVATAGIAVVAFKGSGRTHLD